MKKRPVIVIHDANALIDLTNGDLLGVWFRLGYTSLVPRFVYQETFCQHESLDPFIDAGSLRVVDFTDNEAKTIYPLLVEESDRLGISIPDASALWLARRENGLLLSGDQRLATKAREAGVETRGVLWALDELVGRKIVNGERAWTALTEIRDRGARLPRLSLFALIIDNFRGSDHRFAL